MEECGDKQSGRPPRTLVCHKNKTFPAGLACWTLPGSDYVISNKKHIFRAQF